MQKKLRDHCLNLRVLVFAVFFSKIVLSSVWMNEDVRFFTEDENTKWYLFQAPDVYVHVKFSTGITCALRKPHFKFNLNQ